MTTLKRQIGLAFCSLVFLCFALNAMVGAADGGWPRDGYDLGYSYYYPYGTDTPIPDDPFEQDWSIGANGDCYISALTGDVNGDGYLEIVYTRNDTLYVLDGSGNELWSVMLGEGVALNILDDVSGDGIEDIVCRAYVDKGRIMKLLFYDGAGSFLKEIADTIQYYPTWGVTTAARAVVDIDGDGDLEVVAVRSAGYDCQYYPHLRGVVVFDYATGTKEWFYPIGPSVTPVCIADVTGDSNKEIIVGIFGPHNNCCDNGFCDYYCYVICWDKDGNLLWSRQFEGSGFVDTEVSVGDLDGDGNNEIICTSHKHGWGAWDGNLGRVYLLNPDNGNILTEYNVGKPVIVNGFADIVGDSVREIVVNYKDGSTQTGKVLLFDNSLNLLDEYSVAGSRLRVAAINDINGDGLSELLVRTLEWGSIGVLNADLDELWSLTYSSEVKNVIPSDMDNDGVNELLVSTVDGVILELFNPDTLPDTLFVGRSDYETALYAKTMYFPVYLNNYQQIKAGHIPLEYDWDFDPDSVSFVCTRASYMDHKLAVIDPVEKTVDISFIADLGSGKDPLAPIDEYSTDTAIARIYFTIPCDAEDICGTSWVIPPDTTTICTELDCFSVVLVDTDNRKFTPDVESDNIMVEHYRPGDVGGDCMIDLDDIVWLADYAFTGGVEPSCYKTGDANGSCDIDIDDIIWLVNYMFLGGEPPRPYCYIPDCDEEPPLGKMIVGNAELTVIDSRDKQRSTVSLSIDADREVQGVQLEFKDYGNVSDITATSLVDGIQVFYGHVDGMFKVGLLDIQGRTMISSVRSDIVKIDYTGDGELDLVNTIIVAKDGGRLNAHVTDETSNVAVPKKFSLDQNVPNPFNPTTEISFNLPKASDVKLEVFNIMGQKIITLADEYMQAGNHTVTFNGRSDDGNSVASGVYFYKIEAGDFTESRKMLLLK